MLERALNAGLWAQNHRLTEPWRFIVLGPIAQQALAEAGAIAQLRSLAPDTDAATRTKVQAAARQKILSNPRIVTVTYLLSGEALPATRGLRRHLLCHPEHPACRLAEGLGMQWNTGKQTQQPQTYTLLCIDSAAEEIAGFLYFGYPTIVPPPVYAQAVK